MSGTIATWWSEDTGWPSATCIHGIPGNPLYVINSIYTLSGTIATWWSEDTGWPSATCIHGIPGNPLYVINSIYTLSGTIATWWSEDTGWPSATCIHGIPGNPLNIAISIYTMSGTIYIPGGLRTLQVGPITGNVPRAYIYSREAPKLGVLITLCGWAGLCIQPVAPLRMQCICCRWWFIYIGQIKQFSEGVLHKKRQSHRFPRRRKLSIKAVLMEITTYEWDI